MTNENKNLIIAYFPDSDSAKEAANELKHWDKKVKEINLGSIGIVTLDKKGHLKTHKVGARATDKGAELGVALGAVAGVLSGGITLVGGALAGIAVGAVGGSLFHKRLGMEDDDKARLETNLQDGGAALAVMAYEYELDITKAKIANLGGEVEHYAVPHTTVSDLEEAHGDEETEETPSTN